MRHHFSSALVVSFLLLPLSASAVDRTEPTRLLQFTAGLHRVDAPGLAAVTFALYRDQEGGSPLWSETQSVEVDDKGRFSVVLGAGQRIPLEIFSSGDARWLGIQRIPEEEQPRILLASVPYALKAADADTLGGKPLSAFVLADPAHEGGVIEKPGQAVKEPLIVRPPLASLLERSQPLRPITNAAVTTGFQMASISGNTSIGFATTGGV